MKKLILFLSAASFLAVPFKTMAQAKLVEKVTKKGDEIVIPYEKYVLPNGLTVIIHEDKSDPMVHVDVTYHVGSAREELGKSGFAHFFEHMMFQGSDNVGDEQHFKIITEAGGTLNGTTNRDRTNYYETVPANQLEKMLWLESDRMGFLLDAVTQEKFEIQRATVKNERGQNYDNRPYGLLNEVASKNLYPYGHPYSWLTIGYIEDLNRVNVGDLKNFFLRWYGPNNAVLTIGGDVDKKQTLEWVNKYFGSIPRGEECTPAQFPLPVLDKDRYVTMVDNYAKVPMIRIVFPSTKRYSKEEPAFDCLADVLGGGKNSVLYKNLVKTGLASSANAYNYTSELSGEFTINVTPFPGKSLAEIEKAVMVSINEINQRGISDEDVTKFVNSMESQLIYGLESLSGKVSTLAANYTFTKDANYLVKEIESYRKLNKAEVMKVYKKDIENAKKLVVSVVTLNDSLNQATLPNYNVDTTVGYLDIDYGYEGLKYNKAKDNFDRTEMPGAGKAPVVTVPKYYEGKVAESIKSIGTTTTETPIVTAIIKLKGGSFLDPKDKTGLASLFTAMLNEDTKNYTAEAFAEALDKLGSSISISAGNEDINIQVRSLKKNLDATLALLDERIMHPAFNEEDFARTQKRTIESIKSATTRPAYVASVVYESLMYAPTSPLGRNATPETIANITLEDIKNFYKQSMSRNNAEIIVVGDIKEAEVKTKFNFLSKLSNQAISFPAKADLAKANPATKKGVVYIVDIPNAAQTEFRIGTLTGVTYDYDGDYYKSTIVNYPLGGAFNSRLNLYLREEKGWTYGARSGFSANKYTGSFNFSGGIKADATDSALVDVLKIIENYKVNGIKPEELAFTKNAMTNIEALKYETGAQKAGFLSLIQNYNLPSNFKMKQQKVLDDMTVPTLNANANKLIPNVNTYIILLVGDKAKIAETIKNNGFTIVELDKQGNLVK